MSTKYQELKFEGKTILPKFRSCSDFICFAIFAVSFVGFLFFTVYGYINANIDEVFHSLDSDGFYCGVDERQDYPYMYRPTPQGEGEYYQICVKECPQEWQSNVSCYTNSYIPDCNFYELTKGESFYNRTLQRENFTSDLPFTYPSQKD